MKPQQLNVFEFRNVKQSNFYDHVMKSVAGLNKIRYFFYGGAIRGGKTFVCLYIFIVLARLFPGSRWHIFRSSFPELEDTTIPSMEKLLGKIGKDFIWKRRQSNFHILFANGSKIFFKSEKLEDDPELNWMLGLETNGIFLEQMEGLSEKLFQRAIERVGSWYLPKMPPPLILGTFNPTNNWVKKKIYDPYREGTLPPAYHFEEALPDDNPFVTQDQWANWENLDETSRNQLIKGVWKFDVDSKIFAYAFDKRHIIDVKTPEGKAWATPRKGLPLKVIFDFNVDPITALVAQNDKMSWGKIIREYRLRNSDIWELTERIMTEWEGYFMVATGDATGRNRTAITKGNRNYLHIIKKELKLSDRQMQFPRQNPSVKNTRVLMNSLFHKHPDFKLSSECLWLINDLESVRVDEEGNIDKKKDASKTHLLDNLRYYQWNYFNRFVRI